MYPEFLFRNCVISFRSGVPKCDVKCDVKKLRTKSKNKKQTKLIIPKNNIELNVFFLNISKIPIYFSGMTYHATP